MNAHSLDGNLKNVIPQLIPNTNAALLSREGFIASKFYCDYVGAFRLHPNLQTILQSYNTSANYDSTNNYSCEMVLTRIVEIYDDDNLTDGQRIDILTLFDIQLDEMSSGMCPQGRTHRLLMFLFAQGSVPARRVLPLASLG